MERYLGLSKDHEFRESMLSLVAHISSSDLAESLHPWNSMYVLQITQTKDHPFQESVPFLQISPLSDGSAEFRYIDTYVKSKQWVRIADKNRLSERFESFVEQLSWRAKPL
jgi:hypothetical protein